VSAQQFISEMFGQLPNYFQSVEDLHALWSNPQSREALFERLEQAGYGIEVLKQIRQAIDAENSDLLDVLEYISFATTPIERAERAERLKAYADALPQAQKEFVAYLKEAYIRAGVEELGTKQLSQQLELKFGSVQEGIQQMGGPVQARDTYYEAQRVLYS
jgi:type I restriction enzyme R subunit